MSPRPPYEQADDETLARWSRQGDQEAFGELVRRHSAKIYAKVHQLLRDEQEALEVSQEAWVRAWQKLNQFRGEANFTTWVTRVAINMCFDHIRQRRRLNKSAHESIENMTEMGIPWESHISAEEPDPTVGLEREELRQMISRALDYISEVQRQAIVLHDLEGYEYKEVAKLMRCSVGTVMSRLFYGRRKLAKILTEMMQEQDSGQAKAVNHNKEQKAGLDNVDD